MEMVYLYDSEIQRLAEALKTVYTYNPIQFKNLVETYSWNKDSADWILGVKQEDSLDINGQCIHTSYYYLDRANNVWIAGSKKIYRYSNNKQTLFEYYQLDSYGKWRCRARTESIYKVSDLTFEKICHFDQYGTLSFSMILNISYNNDGLRTSDEFFYYYESRATTTYRDDYIYNDKGILCSIGHYNTTEGYSIRESSKILFPSQHNLKKAVMTANTNDNSFPGILKARDISISPLE